VEVSLIASTIPSAATLPTFIGTGTAPKNGMRVEYWEEADWASAWNLTLVLESLGDLDGVGKLLDLIISVLFLFSLCRAS
jgi:hypothetical protein